MVIRETCLLDCHALALIFIAGIVYFARIKWWRWRWRRSWWYTGLKNSIQPAIIYWRRTLQAISKL